ncbi:MAG: HEAT repeat domain-containing protein [Pseudomonadota bacterium]
MPLAPATEKPDEVARLIQAFKNPDPIIRSEAADELAKMKDQKDKIAPLLVDALLDPLPEIRVSAFLAIRQLAPLPKPLVEKAKKGLQTLLSRFDDPKTAWDAKKTASFVELATYAEHLKKL